jgi:zinc transporter ZupT
MTSSLPLLVLLLHSCLWLGNSQTVVTSPLNADPFLPRQGILTTGQTWWAAAIAIGGISLIGLILSAIVVSTIAGKKIEEGKLRRSLLFMLSLGMGFFMGASIILMLPKAFGNDIFRYVLGNDDNNDNNIEVNTSIVFNTGLSSFFILIGFTFFMVLDMLARHFVAKTRMTSRVPTEENYVDTERGIHTNRTTGELNNQAVARPQGELASKGSTKQTALILLRMFIYNFFSGMTVGTVFATYSKYNILSLCIAMLLAEVFLEIVDTTLLYYSGLSKGKAIILNLLMNVVALGGAAAGRALGQISLRAISYLFAAEIGIFLYLVAVHLMPAIMKGKKYDVKPGYLAAFLIGTFSVFALRAIET